MIMNRHLNKLHQCRKGSNEITAGIKYTFFLLSPGLATTECRYTYRALSHSLGSSATLIEVMDSFLY